MALVQYAPETGQVFPFYHLKRQPKRLVRNFFASQADVHVPPFTTIR
jgi:hypothetical protein